MVKGVIKNLIKGLKNSWPISFLVREVLDRCDTYAQAVSSLKVSELMAPTYITVAGVNLGEGIVITRGRSG